MQVEHPDLGEPGQVIVYKVILRPNFRAGDFIVLFINNVNQKHIGSDALKQNKLTHLLPLALGDDVPELKELLLLYHVVVHCFKVFPDLVLDVVRDLQLVHRGVGVVEVLYQIDVLAVVLIYQDSHLAEDVGVGNSRDAH